MRTRTRPPAPSNFLGRWRDRRAHSDHRLCPVEDRVEAIRREECKVSLKLPRHP